MTTVPLALVTVAPSAPRATVAPSLLLTVAPSGAIAV
jgi:hypothetical protein